MTTPDDDPAELLRGAWDRALDVPLPLDADDEPADPTTAAAVDWTRRAWRAQTATPVTPDLEALVARRRDGPPAPAVEARRPRLRLRDVAAAAAVVIATLGPAWWLLDRAGTTAPVVPLEPTAPVAMTAATSTVVPDVAVASAPDGPLELVSGPVRLVFVTPTTPVIEP